MLNRKKLHLTFSQKQMLILILSGISAFLVFGTCRNNVTGFNSFLKQSRIIRFSADKKIKEIEKKTENISIDDTEQMKQIVKEHDAYTSIAFYDGDGNYLCGDFGDVIEEPYNFPMRYINSLFSLQSDFEQFSYSNYTVTELRFSDGEGIVSLNDMHALKYEGAYFVFSLSLSLLAFILPSLIYTHRKVRYMNQIKDMVLNMAAGDLQSEFPVKSHDELAVLANEMNNLRKTLDDNIQKEKKARENNHELVTTLSHDLRTPLTTLRGYLEILRLKKFKDLKQAERYMNSCFEKLDQIQRIADKTFEYATVFDVTDDFRKDQISSSVLEEYFRNQMKFLRMKGFEITESFSNQEPVIRINLMMIKRVMNNLCSNVLRYADPEHPVIVRFSLKQHILDLSMQNTVNQVSSSIESNGIGLESVRSVVEKHEGSFFVQKEENLFTVILKIPC